MMELSIGQNVNLTQAAPEVHNILVGRCCVNAWKPGCCSQRAGAW